MPAERKPIPKDIMAWYRTQRARGRDHCVHVTGLSPLTIQTIDRTGTASPAVIGRIKDARDQDPTYRGRVSYQHAVEKLRYLVDVQYPKLGRGAAIGPDSRDRIISALLDVLDDMAVKADLLPPAD